MKRDVILVILTLVLCLVCLAAVAGDTRVTDSNPANTGVTEPGGARSAPEAGIPVIRAQVAGGTTAEPTMEPVTSPTEEPTLMPTRGARARIDPFPDRAKLGCQFGHHRGRERVRRSRDDSS